MNDKHKVINFPPHLNCPLCGIRLRPSTRAELNADLDDVRYREIAESAAQGSRDWNPPDEWAEWVGDISPPGSWLLRCDSCGHRCLWAEHRIAN